jgi:hypothetical protein
MPGKLYQGQGEVVTPHLGDTQIHAMYLGSQYVGYDSRYSTFISASGGTIFDSGSFRYHLFTSSADFTINSLPLSQVNSSIEVLVVGAGAGATNLGGAGAGAVVHIPLNASFTLGLGTYNVIIGSGGASSTNGNPSFISSSTVEIEALGGITVGGAFVSQSSLSGVSGQYGHNEPNGIDLSSGRQYPGGGGAGEPGGNSLNQCVPVTGVGGDGYEVPNFPFNTNKDTATTAFWGGGGGGGRPANQPGCPADFAGALGGNGGGARGGTDALAPFSNNGMPNSGGGGGQGQVFVINPGTGGSGFVGIRYQFQA